MPVTCLASSLTAGTTRIPVPRYLLVAVLAADAGASYRAVLDALIALIVSDGPLIAVVVSVMCGLLIDLLLKRKDARTGRNPAR